MRKHILFWAGLILACHSYAAPNPCQVLSDVGITNVSNASLIAIDTPGDRAVVTAQQGTNYVAVVAHRGSSSGTSRWLLSRAQFKFSDRCVWKLGRRDYPRAPTKQDIAELLGEICLGDRTNEFTF